LLKYGIADLGCEILKVPRLKGYGIVTVAAVICLVACGGTVSSAGGNHTIEIERQVWLGGIEGRPTALAILPAGGYVIAGHLHTGWAVATDVQGTILWKYEAPLDESLALPSPAFSQSKFHGVVPLANGNILLCGEKYINPHKIVALLTILSGNGQVLDERSDPTNGDHDDTSSSIERCVGWNDGVVLTGNTREKTAQSPSQ
jgi:hypothetical protein